MPTPPADLLFVEQAGKPVLIPILQTLAAIMSVEFVDSRPVCKVRRCQIFAVSEDLMVATHPTSYQLLLLFVAQAGKPIFNKGARCELSTKPFPIQSKI
ncbi:MULTISPECIES: hypothetical protein [unclassified Microcoleus]|uniref:hypothetical protein n=1 Tax=unclassified Microcoleus TaxID=2642155 RepID=UPI002FD0CA1E